MLQYNNNYYYLWWRKITKNHYNKTQ